MPLNKKTSLLVQNLNSLSKKQLKFIISLLDEQTIEFFREIFLNLNFNTLSINNENSKKLFTLMRKNRKICEAIADPNTSINKRKIYLKKQVGNGLITLALTTLAPIVANLIANAVSKKK